jgi:choline dehydrogenase
VYDYVIVGAGSAGCVLAGRLSEDPACQVLLLEAGPPDRKLEIRIPAAFNKLFKSKFDWAYETEPQPNLDGRAMFWPRGKTLGGSSSLNAQMYVRGNALDFDHWEDMGNKGWSYGDVLPYFERSERSERGTAPRRGTSGPLNVADLRDPNPTTLAFLAAAEHVGIPRSKDINGPDQDGVDTTQVTQKRGHRWSAADAYLRPAKRRRNLTIVTGAHTRRIILDGARATGVEYVVNGMTLRESAKDVIVSGGAINSPQLLMLSGIGPADQLASLDIPVVQDLPGVGKNLQDHLAIMEVVHSKEPVTLAAAESIRNLGRFLTLGRGMLTSNVAEACGFVRTRPDLDAPDLELLFAPVAFIDHGLNPLEDHGITIGAAALTPRSTGELTLRSADPFAAPRIAPNYLSDSDGDDLRVLVEGSKLARRILDSPPLERYVGEPILPPALSTTDDEIVGHVRRDSQTLYHPVGTCKMGTDDLAVVDPELRVYGVDNLRVVDASVMPVIPRGHTHASTVMIAEKAVDLVRD